MLGLTDDKQLKILLFIFLFLSYMLSLSGNLTIITLTLIDSHCKKTYGFFPPKFLLLRDFIHNCLCSQILVQRILWGLVHHS